MKRFLLFTWATYYPSGGMLDFDTAYDDELEAVKVGGGSGYNYCIFDAYLGKVTILEGVDLGSNPLTADEIPEVLR